MTLLRARIVRVRLTAPAVEQVGEQQVGCGPAVVAERDGGHGVHGHGPRQDTDAPQRQQTVPVVAAAPVVTQVDARVDEEISLQRVRVVTDEAQEA